MVGAQAAHQHAHQGRGEPRLGHRGQREELAEIGVDVGHAVLAGDLGQVGHPVHAAGLLELGERVGGVAAAREAIGPVIDDEVELRPVLRRLADIAHIGMRQQMWELLFH